MHKDDPKRSLAVEPELSANLVFHGAVKSYALRWIYPSEALPPPPHDNPDAMFSATAWLALSDGRVVNGTCMYRSPNATYAAPVHAWFDNQSQICGGVEVIAWMPFAVPDHPYTLPPSGSGADQ